MRAWSTGLCGLLALFGAGAACGRVNFDEHAFVEADVDGGGGAGGVADEAGRDRDAGAPGEDGSPPGGEGGTAGAAGTGGLADDAGAGATGGTNARTDASGGGSAGAAGIGGGSGSGGAAGAGGSAGAAGGAGSAGTSAIDDYVGLWAGTARDAGINYNLEVAIARASVGELVALFYIPAPYNCGGIGHLTSAGATLTYQETLLFGAIANCIGAGVATLTPNGANALNYSWTLNSQNKNHRGSLARRPRTVGAQLTAGFTGVWRGIASQSNPTATRELYLLLADGALGNAVAHVIYVSTGNGCGGPATLSGASPSTLTLSEQLTATGMGCPTLGTVTVTKSGDDLVYSWSRPGSMTTAGGTLMRAR